MELLADDRTIDLPWLNSKISHWNDDGFNDVNDTKHYLLIDTTTKVNSIITAINNDNDNRHKHNNTRINIATSAIVTVLLLIGSATYRRKL